MSARIAHEYEYEGWFTKKGQWRSKIVGSRPYCPVKECERCHRRSSPTWVRKWWQAPSPENWKVVEPPEPVLCIGCLNVMRPLWRNLITVRECRTLINKIKREAAHANQDRR